MSDHLPPYDAVRYLARYKLGDQTGRFERVQEITNYLSHADHFTGVGNRKLQHFESPEFVSDVIDLFADRHILNGPEKRALAWHLTPPMLDEALDIQFADYSKLSKRKRNERWHQMIETVSEIVMFGLAYHDDFSGNNMAVVHNGQSKTGRTLVINPPYRNKLQ